MSKKRGEAREYGSITLRPNGTHQVRMQVSENGKTARKSFGYFKTRREAARALADVQTQYVESSGRRRRSRHVPTVTQLGELWLDKAVAPGRVSTHRLYARLWTKYIVSVIGEKRLDALTRADAEEIQRRAHATLSASSIELVLTIGHSALAYAEEKEEIVGVKNVFHRATRLYRVKRRQYAIVSADEGMLLLSALSESRYQHAFTLMLLLGLRISETLGLRWRDVDLDYRSPEGRGRLTVDGQLTVEDGRRFRTDDTKTESSRRIITPLPEQVIAALRAQRKAQMAEMASDLVFTAPEFGAPVGERSVSRDFHRLIAAAVNAGALPALLGCGEPIADMRLHDLRHSCATILLALGIPLAVVSAILGHKNPGITLRVYSHVLPQMQMAAADAMTRAFAVK